MSQCYYFFWVITFIFSLGAMEKSWAPHYLESKNILKKKYEEPSIAIRTNDQKRVAIPASFIQYMQTIKNFQEEFKDEEMAEIPMKQISSSQLKKVVSMFESVQKHLPENLKGKKFYDAVGKDVHISNGIDLLRAINYLDIQPPLKKPIISFVTYEIAAEQDSPWWKPRKSIPLFEQLKEFGPAEKIYYGSFIARNYFLQTGENLPDLPKDIVDHENYAFSINDYLENNRLHKLLRKRVPGFMLSIYEKVMPSTHSSIGLIIPAPKDDLDYHGGIDLSGLYLDSLDGLENIKHYIYGYNIAKTRTLYLENNKLRTIEPGTFDFMTKLEYIDLSNNKLESIDPYVFIYLYKLKVLKLMNNPLSDQNKQLLQQRLPQNVQINF